MTECRLCGGAGRIEIWHPELIVRHENIRAFQNGAEFHPVCGSMYLECACNQGSYWGQRRVRHFSDALKRQMYVPLLIISERSFKGFVRALDEWRASDDPHASKSQDDEEFQNGEEDK